jgi:uncharacterized peroxidase-related enzyme
MEVEMARIAPLKIADAPEGSRASLQGLEKMLGGFLPNLFATLGASPGALRSLLSWSGALADSGLSERERHVVDLHVSELNGCGYCISAHTLFAVKSGISEQEVAEARTGQGSTARERALLALARRVVRTGGAGAGAEVIAAKEAGITDAEIIDTLAMVALRHFTTAVAQVAQIEIDFPKAPRLPHP